MAVDIVVTGATGRMGSTIIRLANEDEALNLAGVVERPTCVEKLEGFVCAAGSDLDDVLPKAPGAVIIDFTAPEATVKTARAAARHGNPMVAGTTGLTAEQQSSLDEVAQTIPMLWAPNMSVGVNVLNAILPKLVQLLGEAYDVELVEAHHNQKKDAPSGTALLWAKSVAEAREQDLDEVGNFGRHGIIGARPEHEIGVQTLRGGDVVGDHTMFFFGPQERIEIKHQAHSREMFALGALRAAKWLAGKTPGKLYRMPDVLGV